MENFNVLKDIAERTGGAVFLGVVGPVRTGKSTFIKRFMESMVLPNIADSHERERALDEMPQSGSGRTVMTAEPKFIPADAVALRFGDGLEMKVRLVDCVGYPVEGAKGFDDEDGPRMVETPWSTEPMRFAEAAEIGTSKVITDHSTVGVVILSDGSFGDLAYEAYLPAAERVVAELKALGKPFVVLLNSVHPDDEETQAKAAELTELFGVTVLPININEMDLQDVVDVLYAALYEFPVAAIQVSLPGWVQALSPTHWLRSSFEKSVNSAVSQVRRVRDVSEMLSELNENENASAVRLVRLELGTGEAEVVIQPAEGLYFQALSESAGRQVENEQGIMELAREYGSHAGMWQKLSAAMEDVADNGYGVVDPQLDEMFLEEPELIKQGGHFGVRLRASAPSYHIIKTSVGTEITPLIGTEKQCADLVRYITEEFEDDPGKIWQTNIFGKSLHELVSEGISGKLHHIPDGVQEKLALTLQKIVNETGGGIICIIL